MTALQLRVRTGETAALGGLLALAAVIGAGLAHRPGLTVGVTLAALTVFAVAALPSAGPPLILAAALLVAGVGRDTLVPVLRPHEVVLILVVAGVGLHFVLHPGDLRRVPRPGRIEATLALLAVTGSVLPLVWMLVRERRLTQDDLFYPLQLWKYLAVYGVVRTTIRSVAHVRLALWTILVLSVPVAAIGILQALQLFGVPELVASHYPRGEDLIGYAPNRATATLGSSFSVADVMIFSLAIAGALLVLGSRRRLLLSGMCALFVFGAFAAAQFSGIIGIVVATFMFGIVTRQLGRVLLAFSCVASAAAIALQPVIEARLSRFDTVSGLPPSWSARLENLEIYFWPHLFEDMNWLTGVRPAARVKASEPWREWVYIESGHTWLLWTGGVLFAAAFFMFLAVALHRMIRIARARRDEVGAAAIASFTALSVIAALTTLDPHLTLRGAAEVTFALLALALAGEALDRQRRIT